MLEQLGHDTVRETDGKKSYTVTKVGKVFLKEHRAAVQTALDRMRARGALPGGGPPPQVTRAMENLKLAVRLRFRGGTTTKKQLDKIAEAIDAAAIAVERG